MLQQWKIVKENVEVFEHLYRQEELTQSSKWKKPCCLHLCKWTDDIFENRTLSTRVVTSCRLVQVNLEAVLLYHENSLPPVPVGHTIHMKESYENMKLLQENIKYEDHRWQMEI